jgi:predicted Zn-dependent peptidase
MLMKTAETRLANGLRIATAEVPGVESVAVGFWVGVGARHEPARLAGVSHFIEHLLFKGTRTRSAGEISRLIEGRGGYYNAFTQEESTCYYARIAAEHTGTAVELLADLYRHPRFDPGEVRKERAVLVEETLMYQDQPQHLVQEMLGELLWVNHPLGRALIGTVDTVKRMTRADLLAFKRSRYVPGNTVVALAGRVRHRECVDQVARWLGRLPRGVPCSCPPVTRRTRQKDVAVLSKDIEQAQVAVGFRVFGRHHPARYALKLLSVILGENMSSRLFQTIRERHGLAYSIHSGVQLFGDTGVLDVQAGLDAARVPRALDLVVRELGRLREQPVGAGELKRAKDYAIGQLRIGLEGPSNQMMWVGEHLQCYHRVIAPAEVLKRIEAVTAADIRGVARQALRRRRLSVAMVSPGDATRHTDAIRSSIGRLD